MSHLNSSTQPTQDTTVSPTDIKYPKILEQEENQTVVNSIANNKLSISRQDNYITGSDTSKTSTLKNTYWKKSMISNDFDNGYYELFINNGEKNYNVYWMSSRCVYAISNFASFLVRSVNAGDIYAGYLYNSKDVENSCDYAFRPIITLNSNVQIDTTNSGNGSTAAQRYALK